jgi:DNA polymerase/3'-5' exonuclease PolX
MKNNIINNLNKLKNIYEKNPEKKWNLKALKNAINEISKYDKDIISGTQLKNEINGIGDKISKRIDEIILNGFLKEVIDYENENNNNNNNNNITYTVQNENPFIDITGIGDVRAKKILEKGIKTIDEFKKAIENKEITSTHHIDIGLKYYNDFKQSIPRNEIDIIKKKISNILKKIDKEYIFEICGSYRRGMQESSDIDVLITHPDKKDSLKIIINELKKSLITDELTINGNTKFMGVCKIKESEFYRRIDIRFVEYNSFYSSLIYFTGNKNFNILIRKKALKLNMSINEYGIIDNTNNNVLSIFSEKELFDKINMEYLEPTKRNI